MARVFIRDRSSCDLSDFDPSSREAPPTKEFLTVRGKSSDVELDCKVQLRIPTFSHIPKEFRLRQP